MALRPIELQPLNIVRGGTAVNMSGRPVSLSMILTQRTLPHLPVHSLQSRRRYGNTLPTPHFHPNREPRGPNGVCCLRAISPRDGEMNGSTTISLTTWILGCFLRHLWRQSKPHRSPRSIIRNTTVSYVVTSQVRSEILVVRDPKLLHLV